MRRRNEISTDKGRIIGHNELNSFYVSYSELLSAMILLGCMAIKMTDH